VAAGADGVAAGAGVDAVAVSELLVVDFSVDSDEEELDGDSDVLETFRLSFL
jgi:hypothetical protein